MAAASYYQPDLHITPPAPQSTIYTHPQSPQQQPIPYNPPPAQKPPETYPMHPITPSYDAPRPALDEPASPIGYAPNHAPHKPSKRPAAFNRLTAQRLESSKRWLRILRISTKLASALFSIIMFAIMVFVLFEYQSTKNLKSDAKSGAHDVLTAWPKNAKLWPTIMLLAGAGITFSTSSINLVISCCCSAKARRSWKLTALKYAIHIGAWLIITTFYRYEKSLHGVNNDLWGWSCVHEGDVVQKDFPQLNFKGLCDVQSNSWIVSIIEVVLKVIFAIAHFFLYRKAQEGEKQRLADQLGGGASDLLQALP